jgi:hypothetical protein
MDAYLAGPARLGGAGLDLDWTTAFHSCCGPHKPQIVSRAGLGGTAESVIFREVTLVSSKIDNAASPQSHRCSWRKQAFARGATNFRWDEFAQRP